MQKANICKLLLYLCLSKLHYLVSVRNVNTKRHCEEARRSNLLMNNDIQ